MAAAVVEAAGAGAVIRILLWRKQLLVAWFWPLRQEGVRASRAASPATCVCLRVLCRATLQVPRLPGEPLSGPLVKSPLEEWPRAAVVVVVVVEAVVVVGMVVVTSIAELAVSEVVVVVVVRT